MIERDLRSRRVERYVKPVPRSQTQWVVGVVLLVGGLSSHLLADSPESFESLLRRGFELHQRSAFAEAIQLLERADHLKPRDYFANLLLGIDLLRTGEAASAVPRLKLAASLRTAEEIPVEYLGEAEAKLGHFAAAADAYQDAGARSHGSEDAEEAWAGFSLERFRQIGSDLRGSSTGLGVAYRLQAESQHATDKERVRLLRQATESDPAEPGIWSEFGLAQFASGDRAGASTSLEQAVIHDPSDLEAWRLQSLLAAAKAKWSEAAQQLRRINEHSETKLRQALESWPRDLLPSAPNHDWPWRCVGTDEPASCGAPQPSSATARPSAEVSWYREQRWEKISTLPAPAAGQSRKWFERGVALATLHRCAQGLPALERGITANRTEAEYWLSVCYAGEAGRAAQQLETRSGDTAVVHRLRGDVLLRLKRDAVGAATEYRAALLSRSGDPATLERLAEAQFSAGQTEEAAQSAREALAIDPHRMDAMRTLANIATNSRNYSDAMPYLREIVKADPGDRSAAAELGTALVQTGQPDEALHTLKPLLDAGYPDEKGSLHALLGQALRTMGRNQDAAEAFAEARRLSDAYQDRVERNQNAPQ